MGTWCHNDDQQLGFMNVVGAAISELEAKRPGIVPNLRSAHSIFIGSDYGGAHKGAFYEVLTFLVCDPKTLAPWDIARRRVRERLLSDGRRMSYKTLNDRVRRRALRQYLAACNLIPGLVVTVAIDKRIQSLFVKTGHVSLEAQTAKMFSDCTAATIERTLRVTHFVSLLLRGLCAPGQDVLWITDEDELVANEFRLRRFVEIFASISSNYLEHDLGHLKIGTTQSDTGKRDLEDLIAVCDLCAGSLQDVLREDAMRMLLNCPSIWIPRVTTNKSKVSEIMDWFADDTQPLKRVVFVIDEIEQSQELRLTPLRFHGSN